VSDQYSAAFTAAVTATLAQEGGYANDPADPGGETNFGISKKRYPSIDIKNLTQDEAIAIYFRDYWSPSRCDAFPFPIAMALFDIAVNGGAGVKWLQAALGVAVDGVLGPATIAAANAAPDPVAVVGHIMRRRAMYYVSLPTFASFGAGWIQRCFDIYRVAITP
jgi:lysozyme family protein